MNKIVVPDDAKWICTVCGGLFDIDVHYRTVGRRDRKVCDQCVERAVRGLAHSAAQTFIIIRKDNNE